MKTSLSGEGTDFHLNIKTMCFTDDTDKRYSVGTVMVELLG